MARYPIKFLKDHDGQYFFPFMTEDAIFLNESDKTLKDVIDEAEETIIRTVAAGNYAEQKGNEAQRVVDDFEDILVNIETEFGRKADKTAAGNNVVMTLDSSTYVLTLQLRDINNTVLNTQTVDLPLESVVVDGYYDSTTKKIVLELESGSSIEIPVGDLVSGLQSEITSSNKLASDLVDDTNNVHKFVSATEKNTWNNKPEKSYVDGLVADVQENVDTLGETLDSTSEEVSSINKDREDVEKILDQLPQVSGSGSVITLDDVLEARFRKLFPIDGKSSQESTTGKNLFDIDNVSENEKLDYTNGGTTSNTAYNTSDFIKVNQDTNYVLSWKTNYSDKRIVVEVCYYDLNKTFISGSRVVSLTSVENCVFSTPTNAHYLKFDYLVVVDNVLVDRYNIQLEEGSTATSYEPFTNGQPAPNPDYPYPIKDVTGDNEVEIVNKNLFTINNYSKFSWNVFIENPIKKSGTYTVSCVNKYVTAGKGFAIAFATAANNQSIISGNFADYAFGNTLMQSTGNVTEEQANAPFMVFQVQDGNCNQQVLEDMLIQIEKGSQATSYVEHKSQSYQLNLGVENKFNILDSSVLYANVTTENNIDFTYIPTSTNNSDYPVSCKENTAYTFSTEISTNVGADFYIYFVYTDNTDENVGVLSGTGTQSKTITNTSNASKTLSKISFRHYGIGTYNNYLISKPQLEEGSHASSYSPYGQEPIHLRGIGNYKDSIRKSTGKNLFDVDNLSFENSYISSTGEVLAGTTNGLFGFVEVQGNTNYTLSISESFRVIAISEFNESQTFIKRTQVDNVSVKTITTDQNTKYLRIVFNKNGSTTMTREIVKSVNPCLEEGTSIISPEPYGEGVWYVHKEIGDVVLDGNTTGINKGDNTSYSQDYLRFELTIIDKKLNINDTTADNISSNYFISKPLNTPQTRQSNSICGHSANHIILIFINKNIIGGDTVNDFKTWLSTHNTEVQYILITPTYETITDSTLINQLNELYYAYSYNGQTNVFVTSDGENAQLELNLSALADIGKLISNLQG